MPTMLSFLQPISDGGPLGTSVISAGTNLYLPSSLMSGGTPRHEALRTIRKSFVTSYASDISASMSFVVLTGAKRVRGIRMAPAPGKHSIAEPIAVSSCNTLGDFSRPSLPSFTGSTVLPFLMTGSGSTPSLALSSAALSSLRLSHKLLVLKNLYLSVFWNSASSSSGHCAASRSSICSPLSARWPPFLSAAVRAAHSIAKGLPLSANQVSSLRSIVAPRLSELETNMYSKPFSRSMSSAPEPTMAG
mmetsp:Transcript_82896/g.165472  ORF Transcript_82896/g.165472 Transcript_82896/m.165472 type:complete len:247 (-) Transcript_82896:1285-2025(-)